MKVHYYGKLDSLESCYTFQEYKIDELSVYIQKSGRFGYEPTTITIDNPALFIYDGSSYERYVLEDYKIEVINGMPNLQYEEILAITNEIQKKKYNGK